MSTLERATGATENNFFNPRLQQSEPPSEAGNNTVFKPIIDIFDRINSDDPAVQAAGQADLDALNASIQTDTRFRDAILGLVGHILRNVPIEGNTPPNSPSSPTSDK